MIENVLLIRGAFFRVLFIDPLILLLLNNKYIKY